MKLRTTPFTLHTKTPFGIARWSHSEYPRVLVEIEADGLTGRGESAPNAYYGENQATVLAALEAFASVLPKDPFAWQALHEALRRTLPQGHASAKAALEAAYLDLAGKMVGLSVHRLLGQSAPTATTSFTIGIGELDVMRHQAAQAVAEGFSVLKVKLGTDRDEAIVAAVREAAPEARLRVDANAAWTRKEAARKLELLAEHRVELVEQPLPAADAEGLAELTRLSRLPIAADESFTGLEDLRRLHCDIINVKLAKVGGPYRALQAMQAARALGFEVMLGCMVESSLGITAAAQVAGLAHYLDLDGALLVADDPFQGVTWDEAKRPHLSQAPGLGVSGSLEPRG